MNYLDYPRDDNRTEHRKIMDQVELVRSMIRNDMVAARYWQGVRDIVTVTRKPRVADRYVRISVDRARERNRQVVAFLRIAKTKEQG